MSNSTLTVKKIQSRSKKYFFKILTFYFQTQSQLDNVSGPVPLHQCTGSWSFRKGTLDVYVVRYYTTRNMNLFSMVK